jgi:hypothetical protein
LKSPIIDSEASRESSCLLVGSEHGSSIHRDNQLLLLLQLRRATKQSTQNVRKGQEKEEKKRTKKKTREKKKTSPLSPNISRRRAAVRDSEGNRQLDIQKPQFLSDRAGRKGTTSF